MRRPDMKVKVFQAYTGELDKLERKINEWLQTLRETEEVKFTNLTMIGDPMQSFALAAVWWEKR
jgi:hypothetical protein